MRSPSTQNLPDKGEKLRKKKAHYEQELNKLLQAQSPGNASAHARAQAHSSQFGLNTEQQKSAGLGSANVPHPSSSAVNIFESRAPTAAGARENTAKGSMRLWREPPKLSDDEGEDEIEDEDENEGEGEQRSKYGPEAPRVEEQRTYGKGQVLANKAEAVDKSAKHSTGPILGLTSDPDTILKLPDDELEDLLVSRLCGMSVSAPTPPLSQQHRVRGQEEGQDEGQDEGQKQEQMQPPLDQPLHQGQPRRSSVPEQGKPLPGAVGVRARDIRRKPSPPKPGAVRALSFVELTKLHAKRRRDKQVSTHAMRCCDVVSSGGVVLLWCGVVVLCCAVLWLFDQALLFSGFSLTACCLRAQHVGGAHASAHGGCPAGMRKLGAHGT